MQITKTELWSLIGFMIFLGIMAIVGSIFYHYEKNQRIAFESEAIKYGVVKPLIKEGVDAETMKKVLDALEKTE